MAAGCRGSPNRGSSNRQSLSSDQAYSSKGKDPFTRPGHAVARVERPLVAGQAGLAVRVNRYRYRERSGQVPAWLSLAVHVTLHAFSTIFTGPIRPQHSMGNVRANDESNSRRCLQ